MVNGQANTLQHYIGVLPVVTQEGQIALAQHGNKYRYTDIPAVWWIYHNFTRGPNQPSGYIAGSKGYGKLFWEIIWTIIPLVSYDGLVMD